MEYLKARLVAGGEGTINTGRGGTLGVKLNAYVGEKKIMGETDTLLSTDELSQVEFLIALTGEVRMKFQIRTFRTYLLWY